MYTDNGVGGETALRIRGPRAIWLEFFLHFATFSLYSCIWLVARARELNRVNGEKTFTPWMWFFAPVIGVALPFALSNFNDAWNELADRLNVPRTNVWGGGLPWVMFLIIVGLNLADSFDVPIFVTLSLWVCWCLLFVRMQTHVNAVKSALNGVELTGPRGNLSLAEWLYVSPLALVMCVILLYPIFESALGNRVQALPADSEYVSSDKRFRFPVVGEAWYVVKSGTHSDGSAELELHNGGPLNHMYFTVIAHGADASLAGISRARLRNEYEDDEDIKCEERRFLAGDELRVVARIDCRGTMVGDPLLRTYTLVESAVGVHESIGTLSDVRLAFRNKSKIMLEMADGFNAQ